MYPELVSQFVKMLHNLDAMIDKAIAYASAKKFSPDNFCTARLAPDMLPFSRQVGIACDAAKGAVAYLSGKEAPKFEDNEKTMAELKERIAKTLKYLESFKPEQLVPADLKAKIKIPFPPGQAMHLGEAFLRRSVPNFFFHLTMAYALLRAGGVDLGKADYHGTLNTFAA